MASVSHINRESGYSGHLLRRKNATSGLNNLTPWAMYCCLSSTYAPGLASIVLALVPELQPGWQPIVGNLLPPYQLALAVIEFRLHG
jgi:hypothetical protein